MIPGVLETLATIKVLAEFGIKFLDYLMTEDGQAFSKQFREDRAAWDKTWAGAGAWIEGFFKGELWAKKL